MEVLASAQHGVERASAAKRFTYPVRLQLSRLPSSRRSGRVRKGCDRRAAADVACARQHTATGERGAEIPKKSPPSLDGFDVKVARARTHHQSLKETNKQFYEHSPYQFEGRVIKGGLEHLYWAKNPPAPDPAWAAIIGDCVHNLRTALDYLATQLVLVSGRTPNRWTMFPVRSSPPGRRRSLLRAFIRSRASTLAEIQGGVREDIRQAVDSVQPYQRTPLSQQLERVHELDVVDKHRQLLLAATVVPRFIGWNWYPMMQPLSSMERTYVMLREIGVGDDQPIFKIKFREPVENLTPNMNIYPLIAFSRDEPEVSGLDADRVLDELCTALDDIRALFTP